MIYYDFKTYVKDKNNRLLAYSNKKEEILNRLKNDPMTDWFDIDKSISKEEIEKIKSISSDIRKNTDVFLVIGIGGSYLGAYSFIEAFKPYFKNNNKTEVLFAGYTLSSSYLQELFSYLESKEVVVNFISKSGTTLEPNITFSLVVDFLKKKYKDIENHIIITTDKDSNLANLAKDNNYTLFNIPKNIGGRYSVFSTVGFLPIEVAGIDIDLVLEGVKEGKNDIDKAYTYASLRDILYKENKKVESFGVYMEKLLPLTEWLKQLFAETQGKENKGILPISTLNTRDLHSLGQYYQDGSKILFETNIEVCDDKPFMINSYNLNLNDINNKVIHSVARAHQKNDIDTIIITLDRLSYSNIARLMYFFMVSASIGAYLLDVNPFDQKGVEEYKNILKKELEGGKFEKD